jgi:GNAT superfamily N-acetyltransferase
MLYQVVEAGERHLCLEQLYVLSERRGGGIGSTLVQRLLTEARAHGIETCLVQSQNLDWQPPLRFYQKQGFRPWYFQMFTGLSTEERRRQNE